ncbi:hypothetical protein BASA81_016704 [Batrachochytrium salamandrivorans]|nr:hypothetical protein BASA81_016704 [Batrachochytrium salamandrivorans]
MEAICDRSKNVNAKHRCKQSKPPKDTRLQLESVRNISVLANGATESAATAQSVMRTQRSSDSRWSIGHAAAILSTASSLRNLHPERSSRRICSALTPLGKVAIIDSSVIRQFFNPRR